MSLVSSFVLWNTQNVTSAPSMTVFRQLLKTHFFNRYFPLPKFPASVRATTVISDTIIDPFTYLLTHLPPTWRRRFMAPLRLVHFVVMRYQHRAHSTSPRNGRFITHGRPRIFSAGLTRQMAPQPGHPAAPSTQPPHRRLPRRSPTL